MKFIKLLKMRNKLMLMMSLPVLALLYFAGNEVLSRNQVASQMETVLALAEMSVKVSGLVHELQKERGMTAGFLGSKGKSFAIEIKGQRKNVDQKLTELDAFLEANDMKQLASGENRLLTEGVANVRSLGNIRNQVDAFSIPAKKAIGYYTATNASLLGVVSTMASQSVTDKMSLMVTAYVNFLQAKERAGVERAVMSNTFAKDVFGPGLYVKFTKLVAEQAVLEKMFKQFATADHIKIFEATMTGKYIDETNRMRQVAVDKATTGGFGIKSKYWFDMQTGKINLLKKVEDQFSHDLILAAEESKSHASVQEITAITIASIVLVVTIFMSLMITRLIVNSLSEVVGVAQKIAEGHLTVDIEADSKDEIGQLQLAVQSMVSMLRTTITQIVTASETLGSASEEVSATAQSLSQNASEQAAAVEETSASLEQMNASISQNAENAKATDDMATSAAKQAGEGGTAVSETVEAMKEIAGKIGIIEDIAYKTNLLALNAAIEAARAGEHGKGFAVVADEVRKLAERSQTSAQEISTLASNSVKVAEGAGTLIQEIVPNIQKTADLVQEITAASEEQASGVGQINGAMEQLDKAAQSGAASSEELAATSEEMSAQVQEVLQQVSFFKLGDETSQPMARPRGGNKPARRPPSGKGNVAGDVAGDEADFERFGG